VTLAEAFARIAPSIVAFAHRYVPLETPNDPLPQRTPIIGTGFIIRADGIIATNDHVVRAFLSAPVPPDADANDWGVSARLVHRTPTGLIEVPLEVTGVWPVEVVRHPGPHYGPKQPDLALVYVNARNLPAAQLDDSPIAEGVELATAGYPMGTPALLAPGWLGQAGPFLQRGIVSALLPFSMPQPWAFAMNVMTQGGASGSPVFMPSSGSVVGMLYAGLYDIGTTRGNDVYRLPTNISYVIPAMYLVKVLAALQDRRVGVHDSPTLEEVVSSGKLVDVLTEGLMGDVLIRKVEPRPRQPSPGAPDHTNQSGESPNKRVNPTAGV